MTNDEVKEKVMKRKFDTDEIKAKLEKVEEEIRKVNLEIDEASLKSESLSAALFYDKKGTGKSYKWAVKADNGRSFLVGRRSELEAIKAAMRAQLPELHKEHMMLLLRLKESDQLRLPTDETKECSIQSQDCAGKVLAYIIKATIKEKDGSTLSLFRLNLCRHLEMLKDRDRGFCVFGTCDQVDRTTKINFMVTSINYRISVVTIILYVVQMLHRGGHLETTVEEVRKEMSDGPMTRYVSIKDLGITKAWPYDRPVSSNDTVRSDSEILVSPAIE